MNPKKPTSDVPLIPIPHDDSDDENLEAVVEGFFLERGSEAWDLDDLPVDDGNKN